MWQNVCLCGSISCCVGLFVFLLPAVGYHFWSHSALQGTTSWKKYGLHFHKLFRSIKKNLDHLNLMFRTEGCVCVFEWCLFWHVVCTVCAWSQSHATSTDFEQNKPEQATPLLHSIPFLIFSLSPSCFHSFSIKWLCNTVLKAPCCFSYASYYYLLYTHSHTWTVKSTWFLFGNCCSSTIDNGRGHDVQNIFLNCYNCSLVCKSAT